MPCNTHSCTLLGSLMNIHGLKYILIHFINKHSYPAIHIHAFYSACVLIFVKHSIKRKTEVTPVKFSCTLHKKLMNTHYTHVFNEYAWNITHNWIYSIRLNIKDADYSLYITQGKQVQMIHNNTKIHTNTYRYATYNIHTIKFIMVLLASDVFVNRPTKNNKLQAINNGAIC